MSRTLRMIKNVKSCLEYGLKNKYGIEDNEIVDKFLNIHGMDNNSIEFLEKFRNVTASKLNDVSIDSNSNKNEKTSEGILQECISPIKKLIGFDYLYKKLKENYGKKEAKRLMGEMLDFSVGLSDSTNILKPYCWSLNASDIVTEGRPFGQLHSKPSKSTASYISALSESVHQLSSHLAGAIAIGTFFIDIAHLLIYKEEIDLKDLKSDKVVMKKLENNFQKFIHSVNHLSRSSNESPFTNLSIFDRAKIKTLITDMAWYFPFDDLPISNYIDDETVKTDVCQKYIIEYIMQVQNIFLNFFDKGDPCKDGMPYRFPVCFLGDEPITLNNEIKTFENFITEDGWTDVYHKDMYTKYNGEDVQINRIFKGESEDFALIVFCEVGNVVNDEHLLSVTVDHKFPTKNGLVAAKDLKCNDVVLSDTNNDVIFVVHSIKIVKTGKVPVYNIEVDNDEHLYTLPCGINTANCTLNISKKKYGDNFIFEDDKFIEKVCKLDIYRYNIFVSTGTKIASCCFDKDQKILFKSTLTGVLLDTFENIFKLPTTNTLNNKIFHNGSWRHFKRTVVDYDKKYYKVLTSNNKELLVTEDHLNPTLRGDIESKDLTNNDYLMFNTLPLSPTIEKDLKLTYEQGFLIGAYVGDGSHGSQDVDGDSYQTSLSLNEKCYLKIKHNVDIALSQLGVHNEMRLSTPYNNVYPCTLNSKQVSKFIKQWVNGNKSHNKSLNLDCLLQSIEFRQGIIDGWYETDGGNSNRCYSTSKLLIDNMEAILTSLGMYSIINISDRTDEPVIIRGETFKRNYPLYCLRRYENKNKRSMKNVYIIKNNSIYFKIKSIELVKGSDQAYCVEITQTDLHEPYFTLPNGIITHNCRLINDTNLLEYASQSNSFGGAGVSIGSHRVCTINFNRVALETKTLVDFYNQLEERVESVAKILKSHKDLIMDLEKQGLQPFITNKWINMKRMFSTFGILGIYEAGVLLKEKYDIDYDIVEKILIYFNEKVEIYSKKYGIVGNIEQIPGESFAIRLAVTDKLIFGDEKVPYVIYANQFVPLWENDTNVIEKMNIDGKYNQLITGGGIVHCTIGEKVTSKQAKTIIKMAMNSGCEHFALNAIYNECENAHVTMGKHDKCPMCQGEIIETLTRVVGFFTPVSSWQKERREWEFPNRSVHNLNNELIELVTNKEEVSDV